MKTYSFRDKRIAPRQIASLMEEKERFDVEIPASKMARFMKAVPLHFHGHLRTRVVARNVRAKEIFSGAVVGGLLGLGVGILFHVLKRTHWSITIATTLIGLGIGYFTVRYQIDFYIHVDKSGNEYAKLKFKPI